MENNFSYKDLLLRFYKKYIAERKKTFIVIQILHAIGAILVLLPPLILRQIIDEAIPGGVFADVLFLVGLALAIYLFQAVVDKIKIYHGHKMAQIITRDMRNDLYYQYQKLSLSFHDEKKTGELMSRVIDDLNMLQEFVHHGPEGFIGSSVQLLGTIVILFSLSPRLTIVSLIFVPFLAFFSYLLLTRMHQAFRKTRERKAELSDRLEDNLAGVKVIKAFANEEYETDRFFEKNNAHKEARLTAVKYISLLFPGSNLLNSLGILTVLGYGGYMSINNMMTVGTVVAFYGYLMQFSQPILRLVHINERLSEFFASIERFFAHLEIAPEIDDKKDVEVIPENINGDVKLENVTFSYNQQETVLKDLNLAVDKEKTVALVGPSGAGKTSIVRLIPRLYEVDAGEILIDGVNVKEWSLKELRNSIAMVMQDDYLFSTTIAANISYGKPEASKEEIITAAKEANAHEFITEFEDGYNTSVGQRGLKLSGGQRQRISIARAFLKDPEILILDEATSAVDLQTEKLIQEAVDKVTAGRTTFIIAHRLSTIINADQIVFLDDGKIKEQGTHQELIKKQGSYYDFYKMQFENEAV